MNNNFWDWNQSEPQDEENAVFASVERYSNFMGNIFASAVINEVVTVATGKSIVEHAGDFWEELKREL
jgi:hypothetical protein